jgi:thiol-disulfide isomerase/thioredoxin
MIIDIRAQAWPARAAILLLLSAGCASARPQLSNSPALGRPVDVAAPDLRGREQRVADRVGVVRIVDFWASWCEPCRDQFTVLEELVRAHQAEGLLVYAVAMDEDPAQVEAYLETRPLPFLVLWDKGGASHGERLAIERLPTTLVVDRAGRVRFVHQGYRTGNAALLGKEVRLLLTEPR